jgi:hypothetical protein
MQNPNNHIIIKKTLFIGLISLLFLPMIQKETKLIDFHPLDGSFKIIENPSFKLSAWFDGEYQIAQQKYLNQNIGFKSFFVRSYNQIYFTFFNQARANSVIVGKENYLYEENYIKAHLGRDFIGDDQISEKIRKLQKVYDTLQTKGIDLIVVFAPGKASFYPEYIPEQYNPSDKGTTNYETYRTKLSESNIHFLDLNQWFRNMKGKSDYPLFPKTGIHWSRYGEVLALDTIANYIETIRSIKLPKIHIDKIEATDEMRATDDDIEKGMNLLFNIKDLNMGYPVINISDTIGGVTKPKVITVADSYYWGVFGAGFTGRLFESNQFWYYNKKIHASSLPKPLNVRDVNIKEEIEKNEVIMLLSTDANLYKFSYGFIEQLYAAYFNKDNPILEDKKETRVQFYIHSIKETPKWLKSIKEQAIVDGVSLDDALRKNAEYMVWEEEKKIK